MKLLMTGGRGFIGRNLIPLLAKEHDIISLVRNSSGRIEPHVKKISVDLARNWSVADLPSTIDGILHLAQSLHFRHFPGKAMDVFNVNTATTAMLLDYALKAGAKKFILASSGGVYGAGRGPFSEDRRLQPSGELGYYLGSKLCMEILAEQYAGLMEIIIFRFFFVYGSGQRDSMLIPRLANSVRQGIPIKLDGNRGLRINPIHVEDASEAVSRSLLLDGSHTINIAGPEVLSLKQIGEIIGQYVGEKPTFAVDKHAVPNDLVGDITRMSSLLIEPQIRFSDGIRSVLR